MLPSCKMPRLPAGLPHCARPSGRIGKWNWDRPACVTRVLYVVCGKTLHVNIPECTKLFKSYGQWMVTATYCVYTRHRLLVRYKLRTNWQNHSHYKCRFSKMENIQNSNATTSILFYSILFWAFDLLYMPFYSILYSILSYILFYTPIISN